MVELPTVLWILLSAILGFSLLTIFIQLRMSARLRRLERILASEPATETAAETDSTLEERKAETKDQKRLFDEFLDEDPSRRELPKKEQFAGFRKWRSEKGLNWSPGD